MVIFIKFDILFQHHVFDQTRSRVTAALAFSWGQLNKTFTGLIYNWAIVEESENNSYSCKVHL